jgi:hypothetical protein
MNTRERSQPKIHEGQPLVPIGDEDLADRTQLAHWSLTEALFLLSGNKPPGYESTPHIQDHFWSAYNLVVRAIEMDEICRMKERAGERYFFDSPSRWFAWADKQGSEYLKIDERVRRIFTQSDRAEVVLAEGGSPESPGSKLPKKTSKSPPQPSRREERKAETDAKYACFAKRAIELKKQNPNYKKADLKRLLEKGQPPGKEGWVSANTIERALNDRHKFWAD